MRSRDLTKSQNQRMNKLHQRKKERQKLTLNKSNMKGKYQSQLRSRSIKRLSKKRPLVPMRLGLLVMVARNP
jgi:hypothetical protein